MATPNISIDILNYFKDEKEYIEGITRKSDTSYILTISDYIDDTWLRCDLRLNFKIHAYRDFSAASLGIPSYFEWEKEKPTISFYSSICSDIPVEFIDLIKKFLDKWDKFEYNK